MGTSLIRTQDGAVPGHMPRPLLLKGEHKGNWIYISHISGLKLTSKWQRPMGTGGESLPPLLGEYRPLSPVTIATLGSRTGVSQLKGWLCLLRLKPL